MTTQAFLPVGTQLKQESKFISKGDILELCTGDKAIFLELKRTKFVATINGKNMNVPVYRDRMNTPFILRVVGRDESVITKGSDVTKFKPGQLFSLENHKQAFMFVENNFKNGRTKIIALDLVTKKRFSISNDATFVKIDVNKMKRELISKTQ